MEEITKEWSTYVLVPVDPVEMSDVDSPKTALDTVGPSKIKKTKEVHDLDNVFVKTASISAEKGGDGAEVESKKGEVTLPRDEEDPSKKRKVSPPKPSSRKKMKATRTNFETTLTSDDFKFIVATLNNAFLKIAEKQKSKKEEMFSRIKVKFQEVQ